MEKIISLSENTNIFSCKGILKRKSFLIFTLCVIFLNTLLNIISGKIINTESYSFFQGMAFVISLLTIVVSFFATIKRLRDIGWSAWLSVLSLVPFLMLILACVPSKSFDETDKRTSLEKLKDFSAGAVGSILTIGYFVIGLLQWAAIYAGIYSYTDNWFLSVLLGGFVAYIPLLGTIAGIYGAHSFWNFPLWAAILLYTGHFIFYLAIMGLIAIFEFIEEKRNV